MDDFRPDVCCLNNFIYQMICPNHMMNNPNTHRSCENCIGEHFANCLKGKCIHEIPELIRPGETGELFESGSESDPKEKIRLYGMIRIN